ncbi:cytoplasmic protein [Lentinula edodes]|uniref:Cytoplasmic protein n=1 Tax=Lentinula edodes TaxID=5353 RepID=A0A1Q3EC91_LENED|nr:cytoplasmic protein [Lentinula edodes]
MLYAADYRKLLWNDYSHVLRGIRVEVDDVIAGAGGIEQWLYPVETAPDVLGAYLRALIKYGEGVQGFLRLLAVHHVAANIWPDFYLGAVTVYLLNKLQDQTFCIILFFNRTPI